MNDVLPESVAAVVDAAGGEPDQVLREMATYGGEESFPIIGPAAGRTLRLLARAIGAERVFEFGSGFGYSGAWWAGALPADGELVLTDFDAENLRTAREFFERADWDPTVRYEEGDAVETFAAYDGPFDAVLFDHEKAKYAETLPLVKPELEAGSVLVADNMLGGPVTPEAVRDALAGAKPADDRVAGVAAYIEAVRDDPDFETTLLPLGEGVAVSYRR